MLSSLFTTTGRYSLIVILMLHSFLSPEQDSQILELLLLHTHPKTAPMQAWGHHLMHTTELHYLHTTCSNMVFAMDKLWLAWVQFTEHPSVSDWVGHLSQSHPFSSHCCCPCEQWSPPAEWWSPQMEHSTAPHPVTPRPKTSPRTRAVLKVRTEFSSTLEIKPWASRLAQHFFNQHYLVMAGSLFLLEIWNNWLVTYNFN